MKKFIIKNIAIFAVLLSTLFVACYPEQEIDYDPELKTFPEITFTGFSPTTGYPGTPITITGTNFGDVKQATTISFSDTDVDIDTEIISYSDTEMVVLVPQYAGSGPINLKVWTNTAQSSADFIYIPGVEINSYSPASAAKGEQISILGNNFGTDASAMKVYFANDAAATIESISNTELVVTVPDDGVTGAITVKYDNENRETVGPNFIYLDKSIVYDDFLETSPEFGGCLDRSGTQPSGYWPSTQPINAIGDREWELHDNNQSGRNWGYVAEGSGELTVGPARGFAYDISSDAASGYTKPTTLTLEMNYNIGSMNMRDRGGFGFDRWGRGLMLGFLPETKPGTTSQGAIDGHRGVIITPTNEIILWDGEAAWDVNKEKDYVSMPDGTDISADHHLKLTVDTTTGDIVSFEFDGTPLSFPSTDMFTDANTKYLHIGGSSNGSGSTATAYDIRFY